MGKIERFQELVKRVHKTEIRDLLAICKNMSLNQKIIYTTASIYFRHRSVHDLDSPITLCSASIGLASKIFDQPRNYKDIVCITRTYFNIQNRNYELLNETLNIECQICIENMFEIDIYDPYTYLHNYTTNLNLSPICIDRALVFLNDTIYLPYSIVFRNKKIVEACVSLSLLFDDIKDENENKDEDVVFIINQIVDLYSLYY